MIDLARLTQLAQQAELELADTPLKGIWINPATIQALIRAVQAALTLRDGLNEATYVPAALATFDAALAPFRPQP